MMKRSRTVELETNLLIVEGDSITFFEKGVSATVKPYKRTKGSVLCVQNNSEVVSKVLPSDVLENVILRNTAKRKEGEKDG